MTPEVEFELRRDIANLKELVTMQIEALRELTEARFMSSSEALKIQAAEYERRLDALNGEAARLREIQSEYLPREVYDSEHKEINKKIELLALDTTRSEGTHTGKSEGISAAWAIIVTVIVLAVSVVSMIISLMR